MNNGEYFKEFLSDLLELVKQNLIGDVSEVGEDSNLEDFGLDSISSVEIVMSLKDVYEIDFSPEDVFVFNTVKSLAEELYSKNISSVVRAYSGEG